MANVSLDRLIDDVGLISNNNESDYGDLDDDLSDIYFPPMEELCRPARRDNVESGNVDGAVDNSINATSGDDGNTKELLVTDGADPDDRSASSQQQQTRGLERSPAPPSVPSTAATIVFARGYAGGAGPAGSHSQCRV
ncbi:hypothetical protein DL771_005308 [Monosporascus sp. 5C6A]|nr:hypothetical protein DL771_005308 [Monosporascus sp. 5C6A]